ncbi:transposase [bacterium]|nr:MAG: transposase [bacterium]
MPRPPRISLSGLVYHIINRGNNRQAVFKEEEDFDTYLKTISKFKEKYSFKLYGYCLMNNHTHLIIEPAKPNTLSKIIQSITLSHIRLYHAKYKSSGHLWQGRFKNPIIQTDEYLLQCLKYIELNPVRARIVSRPQDYRWSSYCFHAFGKDDDKMLDKDPAYLSLAATDKSRQEAYQAFMEQQQDENLAERMRKSIAGDPILGSDSFIDSLRERLSLARPRPRGRPRKR